MEGRDSGARLAAQIEKKPDSILVAEEDGKIVGTVSLIYDERVAWLFRFAAEPAAVEPLYEKAVEVLRSHGHKQVLVYSESGNRSLDERYVNLGFNQGNDFTAFWREI
jgi:N-acetylglutamate synthase-like GNAT family acetyltransferase